MKDRKVHIQKQALPKEKGVGLIEVLIAMLVFGTALVTLSGLQTRSLQFNQSAYLRSQASMLAYDIIDRIRINRVAADSYDIEFGVKPEGSTFEDKDLISWLDAVGALPSGEAQINCGNYECEVEIRWTEFSETAGDINKTASFIYTSRI